MANFFSYMKSKITNTDINRFLIKIYFRIKGSDSIETKIQTAINMAYLDFCRTLRGFSKTEKHDVILSQTKLCLKNQILKMIKIRGANQFLFFDEWHKETCDALKKQFFPEKLYYGQTQKWINMAIKYLFILEVDVVRKNWPSFHIPIDNIILNKLKSTDCTTFDTPWSKIDDYEQYLNFQKCVREKFEIPMDAEFKLWLE